MPVVSSCPDSAFAPARTAACDCHYWICIWKLIESMVFRLDLIPVTTLQFHPGFSKTLMLLDVTHEMWH